MNEVRRSLKQRRGASLALLMTQAWRGQSPVTEVVPYSEFEHALADGRADCVVIRPRANNPEEPFNLRCDKGRLSEVKLLLDNSP
ncbi:MAG: hypothetical protein HY661_01445 [Betaproteobacteria bacterium]|nr:hypothetical protein [Betaproteobacteria bacterium]